MKKTTERKTPPLTQLRLCHCNSLLNMSVIMETSVRIFYHWQEAGYLIKVTCRRRCQT